MLRPSPPAKATAFHNGIFGRNGIFCMINRSADGSKIVGRNSLGTFTSYSLNLIQSHQPYTRHTRTPWSCARRREVRCGTNLRCDRRHRVGGSETLEAMAERIAAVNR